MSLFKRLFGEGNSASKQPEMTFGRFTDSHKSPAQYAAWDKALLYFEQDDYLDSFKEFFKYLKDENADNVRWKEENGVIYFELFQGSKKVHGQANARKLIAEAKVAATSDLNIAFMRRLIEQNFELKYGRFALDEDNDITILFDTYTLDGSPYKLYFALKEIAVNADKMDDLLIEEFPSLRPVESIHIEDIPASIKEIKYNFIQKEIKEVMNEIDNGKLKEEQYPGAVAYLLLDLIYKLDYLISSEGYMMEVLERIHRKYFDNDGSPVSQKNQVMRRELEKLLERPKEAFFKEMYKVKATFGITTPVSHDKVVSFIDGELQHMPWYKDNGHTRIALSIPGYIVGYCLFNYAVPMPVKDLFHVYIQTMEPEFFRALDIDVPLREGENFKVNKKALKKVFSTIEKKYSSEYPGLKLSISGLELEDPTEFAFSYMTMLRNLEIVKA
ncbi:MAG: hypothetical protein KDC24_13735 [Saprospiraceae bacterium]|nr:hypothetical protein [Saprospiraceae bacterium]